MTNKPINEEVTPEVEEVSTPEVEQKPEMSEAEEKAQLAEAEAAELNKKVAAVTGSYFRALAAISDEEIYEITSAPKDQENPRLLELINSAFTEMMSVGGDLPQLYFDSYTRVVESFTKTFSYNIDCKLEANRDAVIAIATGKTKNPERISHQDIADVAGPKA